ncbi:alanine racemase [Acidimicrobium ferrooxidans DSM 10331]|uniref:Alanine racemase n=1 Tax=Acidimicrobium ferrooxidans (strain DSM 10331 / JCM 15462 / NBRC 103882 / ICP) TaxID=525909 RepID=C7M311_ACIFD|nr:alanine racemase [Acidimicrobium ferrooxidans]ACU53405.1 alanine racemase [Acidimicrobium ferrooxidans DSM 10331]
MIGHRPTEARIDLERLRANARLLAERAAPAALSAVVKADAYGHGASTVARALGDLVDAFCVATVEEGLALRAAGVTGRVLVLSEPPESAVSACAASSLEPFVEHERFVEALAGAASALGREASVHIDVDTGMHRSGVHPAQAATLAASARRHGVRVVGVASHLVRADEAPTHPTTLEQLSRFREVAARIGAPERHLLATGGLLALPEGRFERVRVGIGLYGYGPRRDDVAGLRPVLRLVSHVVRLEALGAGEAVSYGHRRPLDVPAEVATLPIGYADGVPRAAFDAGLAFWAKGVRLPIAGTVTMDQTMVAAPRGLLALGDEVSLIGDEVDAWEWADVLGTIPYEVLARLGPRIPRVVEHGTA